MPVISGRSKGASEKSGTLWIWEELKLQYFGHLMRRDDSLEKTLMLGGIGGRRKRGQQRMRWLDGITNLMDVSLSELWELAYSAPGIVPGLGAQRSSDRPSQTLHPRPGFSSPPA